MPRIVIRTLIVVFWIGIIFCALYFPSWKFLSLDRRAINVFAWGDILDPQLVAAFEEESGIKVRLNYYSSNEELLVKLKATRGLGYDLIIPSDYAVAMLREEGLLKPLDRSKLTFWNEINPRLLGHSFDPQNEYSIPYEWEIFGFGIDKNYFQNRSLNPSWKMVFDKSTVKYNITMMNDPFEAVQFGAFYLYGSIDHLKPDQVAPVRALLVQQKKWVEAYAEFRGDYFLATKNCPVVIASSSYIWRTMRQFPFVGFVVPKEGTFITIENLSIPAASEKERLVYQFINYLYRPETVAAHYKTFGFFPATLHPMTTDEIEPETRALLESDFKNYHFIHRLLPEQQMRDLWVEIKSQGED